MGFFNDLNGKLATFMMGRNGSDSLSRWSLGAAIVVLVITMFLPNPILMAISYALLFYSIYRIFSSNIPVRKQENERFDAFLDRCAFWRKGRKGPTGDDGSASGASTRKTSSSRSAKGSSGSAESSDKMRITCEQCGQALSVPKGRGTLKVTCPKCNHQMRVES